MIDSLQELASNHHNAPLDLIGYLTQTAETLITDENSRTDPEPVSINLFSSPKNGCKIVKTHFQKIYCCDFQ